jgi:hypothetical protein
MQEGQLIEIFESEKLKCMKCPKVVGFSIKKSTSPWLNKRIEPN